MFGVVNEPTKRWGGEGGGVVKVRKFSPSRHISPFLATDSASFRPFFRADGY